MGMHIVITGNPNIGFQVWGPFKTEDDAYVWGSEAGFNDWTTMPLNEPSRETAGDSK